MKKNNIVSTIALVIYLLSNEAFSSPLISSKKKDLAQPIKTAQDNSNSAIEKSEPNNLVGTAFLQGLNKVTGKTSELKIKVGGEIDFGKLTIKVKKCWRSSPDQRPESKILLQVEENEGAEKSYKIDLDQDKVENVTNEKAANKTINNSKKTIFYGWMFSSSPSISGLEHPIYDITAIECKN